MPKGPINSNVALVAKTSLIITIVGCGTLLMISKNLNTTNKNYITPTQPQDNLTTKQLTINSIPSTSSTKTPVLIPWSGRTVFCTEKGLLLAQEGIRTLSDKQKGHLAQVKSCYESCTSDRNRRTDDCNTIDNDCIDLIMKYTKVCGNRCQNLSEDLKKDYQKIASSIQTSIAPYCSTNN